MQDAKLKEKFLDIVLSRSLEKFPILGVGSSSQNGERKKTAMPMTGACITSMYRCTFRLTFRADGLVRES